MKKLICVLLTLALTLCLSSAVFAGDAEKFSDMFALLDYWGENGYPDDVGSIYSTDGTYGNFTVQLVTDDLEAREAEIRAMLEDSSNVTFEKGTFTDKQLHEISQEIRDEYMVEGSGITNVAAGWGSGGGFGPSGQEMRVVVTAEEDKLIELAQTLGQRYGDAVIVQPVQQQTQTAEEEPESEPAAETQSEAAGQKASDVQSAADAQATADGQSDTSETGRISEKTESTILSITFIALGALAAFLIIYFRRKTRKLKK